MASIIGNTYNKYQWYISYSEGSINKGNNTSVVTASLVVKKVGSNGTSWDSTTSASITIDGTKKSASGIMFDMRGSSVGSTKTLVSSSKTITHNSDGTKSITLSGTHSTSISMGTQNVSGKATLTKIPRTSSVSARGNFYTGGNITIDIARNNSTFTHKVYTSFNNANNYALQGSGIATSLAYTIPSSWANSMVSTNKGTLYIRADTYNGNTLVGSHSISYLITVNPSLKPTINTLEVREGNPAITSGVFIKDKSILKIDVSASGVSGSTIKSYSYYIAGVLKSNSTSTSYTSGVMTTSGNIAVRVDVTDSRGVIVSGTVNIVIKEYSPPSINYISVKRCNASNGIDDNGSRINLSCVGVASNFERNNYLTVGIQWKLESATAWGNSLDLSSNVSNPSSDSITTTITNQLLSMDIGTAYAYVFRLFVIDKYNTEYSNLITMPPTFVPMDYKANGKGICFGSTSTKDGVEIKKQKFYVETMDVSSVGNFYGDVYLKKSTQIEGSLRISANATILKNSSGEPQLNFEGCGNSNKTMRFYGSDSVTFGLWNATNSNAVFRYDMSGDDDFHLYKPLVLESNNIVINNSGNIHSLVSKGSAGNYFGNGGATGTMDSLLRGKNTRLYAHAGGGVFLGSSGSTAITSDRNMKHNIKNIDEKYVEFFKLLRPITFIYNKGHRKHVGFVAQEIEDALIKTGLTTSDFAGIVIEKNAEVDIEGDGIITKFDKLYSLRYEEFISLNTLMIQGLLDRVNELEKKIL